MRAVTMFNTMSSLFGMHSQVIDFGEIVNDDVASIVIGERYKRAQPNYWQNYCYVFGIAFALSYPVSAWKLLLNYHLWASKSINFYVNYLYYSSRYFVVVSIFFMQVRYSRESNVQQRATIKIFRRIYEINRCIANRSANEEWKRLQTVAAALNVINWWQMTKIIVAFFCYTCTNYLKLTHVFFRPRSMNYYDIFWFYLANILIRLYASMFSITILQQAKLFELLNETIKAITNAVDESPPRPLSPSPPPPKTTGTTANRFNSSDENLKRRIDGGWQYRAQSRGTYEKHIKLLMLLHDQLRAINLKLDKLHSIQAISVVANAFLNLISQVQFIVLIFV